MDRVRSKVEVISDSEIELIHDRTLEILSTVGCHLPHQEVLTRLAGHGAEVDFESAIAKLPREFVERVMKELSGEKRITGDEKFRAGIVRDGRVRIGLSTQANMIDYRAAARRRGTSEDVLKGIVVCNELEHVTGSGPVIVPSDVPAHMADLYGYYLCAVYSSKPFGTYILSPESGRLMLEIARIRYPHDDVRVSYLLEPNGALSYDDFSLEMATSFAEAGQAFCLGPMAMAGLDAPVTIAGTLLMQNAYNLIGNAIAYLWGQSGGWSGGAHTADLRNGICSFGSPNQIRIGLASVQIANWYGFDTGANCALTDACVPDFQAGYEKGASAMAMMLAGGGYGAQGLVGADQGFSLEQIVIDNEWASAMQHAVGSGIEVTDETLGADAIRRTGILGSFLTDEHTLRHMRKAQWTSTLFNWEPWDAWKANGGLDVEARAHARVEEILAAHYPPSPVVDGETKRRMDAVIDEARSHRERFEMPRFAVNGDSSEGNRR